MAKKEKLYKVGGRIEYQATFQVVATSPEEAVKNIENGTWTGLVHERITNYGVTIPIEDVREVK